MYAVLQDRATNVAYDTSMRLGAALGLLDVARGGVHLHDMHVMRRDGLGVPDATGVDKFASVLLEVLLELRAGRSTS